MAPVAHYEWPSLSDIKDWYLLDLLFDSGADALVTEDKQILKAGRFLKLEVLRPDELLRKSW